MLVELQVADLGVIERLSLVFGDGMTALTGETGAGKTLLVEAIELLVGGRADPTMVRAGATEAVVEGRFVDGDDEVVVRRVVPATGRSRAYVDGQLATAAALGELGARHVDLHGQHAHQSLLRPAVQRAALDRFAGIDLGPLEVARKEVRALEEQLAALGGDARGRAREIDLLRFQVAELDAARLGDVDEDARLDAEETVLGDAVAHREAAAGAVAALAVDGGATGSATDALGALEGRPPFADLVERLRGLIAELGDLADELRRRGEAIEEDPARLTELRERRALLRELRRKYGDDLAAVLAYADEARARLAELEGHDARAAEIDRALEAAHTVVAERAAQVGAARRAAAPDLASAVETHLQQLALPRARFAVHVGDVDPGDDVELRLAANPGSDPLPLTKAASGGELARTMLAVRLVLSEAPDTLVFDEVDAGIGGEAAVTVGRALARLGAAHQVLVVTHLPQVAAAADAQIQVVKVQGDDATTTDARLLGAEERIEELARMLSGGAAGAAARSHAEELLATQGRHGRV